MSQHMRRLNRPVFALDKSHPAKRFLKAFIDCRLECGSRELGLFGKKPVDQEWQSASDGQLWKFSSFYYIFIAFDMVLEGFLENSPTLTPSEELEGPHILRLRKLVEECVEAAEREGNRDILPLTDSVLQMLGLWEHYLDYRREMVSQTSQK